MEGPKQLEILPVNARNLASDEASPSDPERRHSASVELRRKRASVQAISSLPDELLDFVFQLALPYPDVLAAIWWWTDLPCHSYLSGRSILRRVCKLWKDLVDSSPPLWSVISSTFPLEMNKASLVRSGNCPLLIHYVDPEVQDPNPTSPFQNFLLLVGPHLHRSSSVAIQRNSEIGSELPTLTSPHLVNLNIRTDSWVGGQDDQSAERIEIPSDILKNIKGLALSGIQLDWKNDLYLLRGLRALDLFGLFDSAIASEQLLDVLAGSPDIENFSLDLYLKNDDPWSERLSTREPISLSHLHSLRLHGDGKVSDLILCNVRPPPSMEFLDIGPHNFSSLRAATTFWMNTVAVWAPAVRGLHDKSSPFVEIFGGDTCRLGCEPGPYQISLDFVAITRDAALSWISRHIGDVAEAEGGKGLHVASLPISLLHYDVLASIQSLPAVKKFSARHQAGGVEMKEMEALLNFLADPISKGKDAASPKPCLPRLQTLVLADWVWNLHALEDMIRRRYSLRSTTQHQIPDLTIKITQEDPWSDLLGALKMWRNKAIISLSTVTAFRRLDGVQGLSISCRLDEPGLLAVIWDEDKSAPAWV
ncbi:hypothetical protein FRB90_007499 [Tulasnella sp. 427]|nr:hypothetical protein FRB90_007499 [Tulasnella sp. 427]